jgi:dihydrofolate reductase
MEEQEHASHRAPIDMTKVVASITTSLDGYITGPNDGPGCGLGEGGERLHYWVFGGSWSYEEEPRGEASGVDKEYLDGAIAHLGAVIGGRNTYEAAEKWGGSNPWPVPFFIVTHRTAEAPAEGFTFVGDLGEGIAKARDAAGDKDVSLMGGADVIRQALRNGQVDELNIEIAPVVLGGGKRLFEGFDTSIGLEHIGVMQSPFATHIQYRVVR